MYEGAFCGECNLNNHDKIWARLSRINVLIVMDGIAGSAHYASFGQGDLRIDDPPHADDYFGLSELVHTLTSEGPSISRFSVTKAHRDTDVRKAADIENFHFDTHDLSVYDEIWLIGVAATGETNAPMSDAELKALTKFMDGGGGVFATGDHEDLGVELNGRVPRVRSMRKWYYPVQGPNGEPVAPPAIGEDRIDTTQVGHGVYEFDNQSDDIPQKIKPRLYIFSHSYFITFAYPHPLLCGPNGTISVLPDHMHEGEVIKPWDMNATLTFGGESFVEYPKDRHGFQEEPEIVAWGEIVAAKDPSTEPAHTGDPTHVATARSFGVIGAYDGHRVGVGRVAVDSTWHHFFDINLIGDPIAPPPKTLGFKATSSGLEALSDIKAYYRNIGTWIARPSALIRIFSAAAWVALHSQPLNMLVSTRRIYTNKEMVNIGSLALKNLHRIAPPCTFISALRAFQVEQDFPIHLPDPDPWTNPHRGDPPVVDPSLILKISLGSAIVNLAKHRNKLESLEPNEAVTEIIRVIREGILTGLKGLGADIARYAEGLEKLANELQSGGVKN
jgi:hypothetical protein